MAAVLKTAMGGDIHRGFESHVLRSELALCRCRIWSPVRLALRQEGDGRLGRADLHLDADVQVKILRDPGRAVAQLLADDLRLNLAAAQRQAVLDPWCRVVLVRPGLHRGRRGLLLASCSSTARGQAMATR